MNTFLLSCFGYAGALKLPGTDLLHMRARVYAAGLGRFLSPDPIGFASGQLNLYAYVGDDPINAIDPSGLTAEDVIENIVVVGTRPAFQDTLAGLLYESMARANALLRSMLSDFFFGGGPGGAGSSPGEGGMEEGKDESCGVNPDSKAGRLLANSADRSVILKLSVMRGPKLLFGSNFKVSIRLLALW